VVYVAECALPDAVVVAGGGSGGVAAECGHLVLVVDEVEGADLSEAVGEDGAVEEGGLVEGV